MAVRLKKQPTTVRSEAEEQAYLFYWAHAEADRIPELDLLFAIPNGGSRHILEAVNLKRQGIKRGIPDIFLPVARGGFHGLFIEMKRSDLRPVRGGKGGLSEEQDAWAQALIQQGYIVAVSYGATDAMKTILSYLGERI